MNQIAKTILNYTVKSRYGSLFLFFINGGVIGCVSWILQSLMLLILNYLDVFPKFNVAISVWFAFFIILFVNFFSMKKFVFKKNGSPYRFLMATTFMIFVVGIFTEYASSMMIKMGYEEYSYIAYPISALLLSPISYIIKKNLVFRY